MAMPACAAPALRPPLQPERGAPASTTCPRRHSRAEAELASGRPRSVAASVFSGPPRGVSRGFNSQLLLDEPLKEPSSLAGASSVPLFVLLLQGPRKRMRDLRRRWDLGSLCRALLTRGLAALGHSLKHVLGAISKIFGPLSRYILGGNQTRIHGRCVGRDDSSEGQGKGAKFQLAHRDGVRGLQRGAAHIWLCCGSLPKIPRAPVAQRLRLQFGLLPPGELRTPASYLTRRGLPGGQPVLAKARLRALGEGARSGRHEDRERAPRRLEEEAPERVQCAKRNGDGSYGATESGRKHAGAQNWVCELSGVTGVPRVQNPRSVQESSGAGRGQPASGKELGGGRGSVRQKPQR